MEESVTNQRYIEAVRYFRQIGFFSGDVALTDEELSARVKDHVRRDWDDPFPRGAEKDVQLADMCMLATDRARVWNADLECVYPGEHAYIRFIEALAHISRRAFNPQNVSETWNGERGPIHVRFRVGPVTYTFVHIVGDMLDLSLLEVINVSIRSSGTAFEVCDNFGMPSFIVALTREEKLRLLQRGWRFWAQLSGGSRSWYTGI